MSSKIDATPRHRLWSLGHKAAPALPRHVPAHAWLHRSERPNSYHSFTDLLLAPPKRPAYTRARPSGIGFHELRGRLADHVAHAEAAVQLAEDRAEANMLRWACRAAWWWARRRVRAWL